MLLVSNYDWHCILRIGLMKNDSLPSSLPKSGSSCWSSLTLPYVQSLVSSWYIMALMSRSWYLRTHWSQLGMASFDPFLLKCRSTREREDPKKCDRHIEQKKRYTFWYSYLYYMGVCVSVPSCKGQMGEMDPLEFPWILLGQLPRPKPWSGRSLFLTSTNETDTWQDFISKRNRVGVKGPCCDFVAVGKESCDFFSCQLGRW